MTPEKLIELLSLVPLRDEGGFYCETYRSNEKIPQGSLPDRYHSSKSFGTAIYYLLMPDAFSEIHRLPTDEIFHFYLGDPATFLFLNPDGSSRKIILGQNIQAGQLVQAVIPRGTWFGALLNEGGNYALMGTTMAPGFDFSDYESGNRELLIDKYPKHSALIKRLTRNN